MEVYGAGVQCKCISVCAYLGLLLQTETWIEPQMLFKQLNLYLTRILTWIVIQAFDREVKTLCYTDAGQCSYSLICTHSIDTKSSYTGSQTVTGLLPDYITNNTLVRLCAAKMTISTINIENATYLTRKCQQTAQSWNDISLLLGLAEWIKGTVMFSQQSCWYWWSIWMKLKNYKHFHIFIEDN